MKLTLPRLKATHHTRLFPKPFNNLDLQRTIALVVVKLRKIIQDTEDIPENFGAW